MGGIHYMLHNDSRTPGIMAWDPNVGRDPSTDLGRKYVGYAARFFNEHVAGLDAMVPGNSLVSGSARCLAQAGAEYAVYVPSGQASVTVDLSAVSGDASASFYDARTGSMGTASTVSGGASRTFTTPSSSQDWGLLIVADGGSGNQAPSASISANPTGGEAPLLVSFDGSASSDPDGTIVSYAWDFGDGSTGTGATASHTYAAAGTFSATLTVTDDDGATGAASVSIAVSSPPSQALAVPFVVTFDAGAESWEYRDDLFRGTAQPGYVNGAWGAAGGEGTGGFAIDSGGIDAADIIGMSGGLRRTISLSAAATVRFEVTYRMILGKSHEDDEYCEALLAVDGALAGVGSNDYLDRLVGIYPNPAADLDTGWKTASVTADLGAGDHALDVGVYHSKKTSDTEWARLQVDSISAAIEGEPPPNSPPEISTYAPETPFAMTAGETQVFEVWAHDDDGDPLSYVWKLDGATTGATGSSMDYSPVSADVGAHAIEVTVSDGNGGSAGHSWAVTVNAAPDVTPPSVPANLLAAAVSHDQVDLSWDASSDDVGVAGYDVFRDGVVVATVTGTSHSDAGLSAETTYMYEVEAFDAAGNRSGKSAPASVTTPAAPPPPSELVITDVVAGSGKAYLVDTLEVGKAVYIDRTYTWTAVGDYAGEQYILTANNDKVSTGDSFLTFKVNMDVTVYVAFDVRSPTLPPWLESWTAVGEQVSTSDVKRNLFSKDFPAGTVTLGGNRPSGAGSMYNPIVKPAGSPPPPPPPNQAPTAVISATPTSGEAPLAVSFDGSGSSDSDGTIVSYAWDFGPSTGSGQVTSYTYTEPGTYTVTLTVTDDDGATDSASVTIVASEPPPPPDTTPPVLSVDSVVLKGQVSDDSGTVSLTVNGQPTTVNPDGSWEQEVTLAAGQTTVVVEAVDDAGNVTSKTVTVNQ
jgi:PKD repeat protein